MLCPKCKKTTLTKIPLLEKSWSCARCGYRSEFFNQKIEEAVLDSLKEIPKGKVTTYKALAERFGIHQRAVAKIMARNKRPEFYPCYKVVESSGRIGGYSGGKSRKMQLLRRDGIAVEKGKIDLTKHLYVF